MVVFFRILFTCLAWSDVPDEIVVQEYGGEIPFERVAPGEEQHWEVKIQ